VKRLLIWILGDYAVGDPALNRFFSLHVIALPLILVILVFLHIVALHTVGSNNPDGVEIKKNKDKNGIPKDGIPFHPYYSVKDIVGVVVFLMIFSAVVFFFSFYFSVTLLGTSLVFPIEVNHGIKIKKPK
jgi:ubiquinol-cytochrome c reductase cytochrome b subunit